jgi:hypothetical protein
MQPEYISVIGGGQCGAAEYATAMEVGRLVAKVIAIGGSYGTLSEIGLAARVGRSVVILSGWRLQNDLGTEAIWYASSPAEAMALIRQALDARGAVG